MLLPSCSPDPDLSVMKHQRRLLLILAASRWVKVLAWASQWLSNKGQRRFVLMRPRQLWRSSMRAYIRNMQIESDQKRDVLCIHTELTAGLHYPRVAEKKHHRRSGYATTFQRKQWRAASPHVGYTISYMLHKCSLCHRVRGKRCTVRTFSKVIS